MMTLPGAWMLSLSLDLVGGFITVIIRTDIRTNPPSISSAVSSQTVRVSSSIDATEQTEVDLQPEIGGDAEQRCVERNVHAVDHGGDHRLDLVQIRRATRLGGGERHDQADHGTQQPDAHDVDRQPFDVAPTLEEDAQDAQGGDAHDYPAQE